MRWPGLDVRPLSRAPFGPTPFLTSFLVLDTLTSVCPTHATE